MTTRMNNNKYTNKRMVWTESEVCTSEVESSFDLEQMNLTYKQLSPTLPRKFEPTVYSSFISTTKDTPSPPGSSFEPYFTPLSSKNSPIQSKKSDLITDNVTRSKSEVTQYTSLLETIRTSKQRNTQSNPASPAPAPLFIIETDVSPKRDRISFSPRKIQSDRKYAPKPLLRDTESTSPPQSGGLSDRRIRMRAHNKIAESNLEKRRLTEASRGHDEEATEEETEPGGAKADVPEIKKKKGNKGKPPSVSKEKLTLLDLDLKEKKKEKRKTDDKKGKLKNLIKEGGSKRSVTPERDHKRSLSFETKEDIRVFMSATKSSLSLNFDLPPKGTLKSVSNSPVTKTQDKKNLKRAEKRKITKHKTVSDESPIKKRIKSSDEQKDPLIRSKSWSHVASQDNSLKSRDTPHPKVKRQDHLDPDRIRSHANQRKLSLMTKQNVRRSRVSLQNPPQLYEYSPVVTDKVYSSNHGSTDNLFKDSNNRSNSITNLLHHLDRPLLDHHRFDRENRFQSYETVESDPMQHPYFELEDEVQGNEGVGQGDEQYNNTGVVNWNKSFQSLLEKEDGLEKFSGLASLARDFRYVAETYGRIIISESFCCEEQKKIKPTNVGGFAGGTKYCCQGILFKFALDVQTASGQWMYGNSAPDPEKAMKAAANERKGLMSLFHCQVEGLHFPLMALIHYMGFCLIAMSLLPIHKDQTLVYGSSDGGKTCVSNEVTLRNAMIEVGKKLNLREHLVQDIPIVGPADIEGHKSDQDGRFYIVDCSRVMPPEAPSQEGTSVFYNLLRPSFVRQYPVPLCSDAWTTWIMMDPRYEEMNTDVQNATRLLRKKHITKFANRIILKHNYQQGLVKPSFLIAEVHKEGINIRHLGLIRSQISSEYPKVRQLILTECLARAIKCELRSVLRKTMQKQKITRTEPSHYAIFQYLAPIFYQPKKVPSQFLNNNHVSVDRIKRTVSLRSGLRTSFASCTVLSDINIESNQDSFFMEIRLLSGNGLIIGICVNDNHDISSLNNYSFSCNDGLLHIPGTNYTRQDCHKDDVVGVFYNRREKRILFTINRTIAGEFPITEKILRPAIGLVPNTEISYNFGTEPFVFDIERKYCAGRSIPSPIIIPNFRALKFWCEDVKVIVQTRYEDCFNSEENSLDYNIKLDVNMPMLVQRIQELSSIKFSDNVLSSINSSFVLNRSDITLISSSVRDMGIIAFAEGVCQLFEIYQKHVEGEERQISILKSAEEKISSSILSFGSTYSQHFYYWGNVFYELAKRSEGEELSHYIALAMEKYGHITNQKNFPQQDKFLPKILYQEGVVLCSIKEFDKASKKFRKMLQLSNDEIMLENHLKNLKNVVPQVSDVKAILSETNAIINAYHSPNPVASMCVVEISMKICEITFGDDSMEATTLYWEAESLAEKYLGDVIKMKDIGMPVFQKTFNQILNTAIDGNQFGVLLELSGKIKELKHIIEERLLSGSLMVTHSRSLFNEQLKLYQTYFSPSAYEELNRIITSVSKIDCVQISTGFSENYCKQPHKLNIMVLGDGQSGKLDLKQKFDQEKFDQIRTKSVGLMRQNSELFSIHTVIDNEVCSLRFYDCNDIKSTISSMGGIIIVYSVKSTASFQSVVSYCENLKVYKDGLPIVLLGNALIDDHSKRVVTYEQGKALADQLKIPFFEAQTHGRSLHKALWFLVRAMLQAKREEIFQQYDMKILEIAASTDHHNFPKIWPDILGITPMLSSVEALLISVKLALERIFFLTTNGTPSESEAESLQLWHFIQQTTRLAHFRDADEFSNQFYNIIYKQFCDYPQRTATKVAMMFKFAVSLAEVEPEIRKYYISHELCVKEISEEYSTALEEFLSGKTDAEIRRVYNMEIDYYLALSSDALSYDEKFKIAVVTSSTAILDALKNKIGFPKNSMEVCTKTHSYLLKIYPRLLSSPIGPTKDSYDGLVCVLDSSDSPAVKKSVINLIYENLDFNFPCLLVGGHFLNDKTKKEPLTVEEKKILKQYYCEIRKNGDEARLILVWITLSILSHTGRRTKKKTSNTSKVKKKLKLSFKKTSK